MTFVTAPPHNLAETLHTVCQLFFGSSTRNGVAPPNWLILIKFYHVTILNNEVDSRFRDLLVLTLKNVNAHLLQDLWHQ